MQGGDIWYFLGSHVRNRFVAQDLGVYAALRPCVSPRISHYRILSSKESTRQDSWQDSRKNIHLVCNQIYINVITSPTFAIHCVHLSSDELWQNILKQDSLSKTILSNVELWNNKRIEIYVPVHTVQPIAVQTSIDTGICSKPEFCISQIGTGRLRQETFLFVCLSSLQYYQSNYQAATECFHDDAWRVFQSCSGLSWVSISKRY